MILTSGEYEYLAGKLSYDNALFAMMLENSKQRLSENNTEYWSDPQQATKTYKESVVRCEKYLQDNAKMIQMLQPNSKIADISIWIEFKRILGK